MLKSPYSPRLNTYKTYLYIGIFVALFVLVFQPFGMHAFDSNFKWLILLGYGGIVFLFSSFILFLLYQFHPKWLEAQSWTIGKQLILTFLVIFSVNLGIYYYSILLGIYSNTSISSFLIFFLFTLIISFFPIIGTGLLTYIFTLKQEVKELKEYPELGMVKEEGSKSFHLSAENGKRILNLELADFVYAESSRNYVNIGHYESGKIINTSIRNTLGNISKQFPSSPFLLHVHRAFFINLHHIGSLTGNSKKLRIGIKHSDIEIPVSRSQSKLLKQRLEQLSIQKQVP